MQNTKIEWTDKVWNPVTGCDPVSEGCRNCYARRMAQRLRGRCGYPEDEPFRVTLRPERLKEPLKLKKPSRIFVCSMGDLFHEDVPDKFIWQVLDVMYRSPQHTFLLLTKRPVRMQSVLMCWWGTDVLKNIWLGVSVEDQKTADERIPLLLQTPAAKRFVSIEPMLGPVDLMRIRENEYYALNVLEGCEKIDWVILGGETGPKARPMHPEWVRSVRDQCIEAGVPFFFKGWGEWSDVYGGTPENADDRVVPNGRGGGWKMWRVGKKNAGALLDGKEYREVPR